MDTDICVVISGWFCRLLVPGSTTMPRLSTVTDSESSCPRRSAWQTAVRPSGSCHQRDNGHLTCRMCALITGLLIKTERVGDAGVGAKAAGWLRRKQHYVTRHPQSAPPPLPPLTALILQRATGQVSPHWLHVLHLGCLAFFSSPKWSSEFHVAGRVTGPRDGSQQMGEIRRGPGTSEAHNGLPRTPATAHWLGQLSPSIWDD